MNDSQREYEATDGPTTQEGQLAEIFREHPGMWLDMPALGQAIGAYAVPTRISGVRRRFRELGLGAIQNRQSRGPGGKRISQYRYTPASGGGTCE